MICWTSWPKTVKSRKTAKSLEIRVRRKDRWTSAIDELVLQALLTRVRLEESEADEERLVCER